ncbi:XdhC family protein [Mesobacillus maritimus]|uniref:XdhC family protein n=1 Tax=Mesobacillus maritimus TaxID=1643336 RepID=A0ABS7K0I3_9BACI|nr:XdhC/CoxI family protein [Mesobacillus maritimus]MBY0095755.1 XdhC family protein [Mesobacillus maritimus]
MDNIHQILNAAPSEGDVLATIIDVDGSAYRKEGTTMLIKHDTTVGILSGGCLEEDVRLRAEELKPGESVSITYNLKSEDDLDWGQGAGCNGSITVLLEKIDFTYYLNLKKLQKQLIQGQSIRLIKKLTSVYQVTDYAFIGDKHMFWGKGEKDFFNSLIGMDTHHPYNGLRYIEELSTHYYFQWFHPKPRLIIVGAGPDAIPLSQFASRTGFGVTVIDWRPALCNKEKFPDADEVVTGFPSEIFLDYQFQAHDFAVLMTHHFERDREFLHYLLEKNLRYIGMVGTKERARRLLGTNQLPPNLYTPVGLKIGAEGPEEIAISILAELIQLNRISVKTKVEAVI